MKEAVLLKKKDGENTLGEREKALSSSIYSSLEKKVEKNYSKEEILKAEEKAERKYKKRKELGEVWNKIQVLFFIAKHPKVWGLPVALPAAAAVLYLVLPVDAVPDMIAGLGLLDDIFVITASISVIIKRVSNYSKEKLLEIRVKCPERLLETFDGMFGINGDEEKAEEIVEPVVRDEVDEAVIKIENTIAGTKRVISDINRNIEREAEINPGIRKSKIYKILDKANTYMSALPAAGRDICYHALGVYLDIELMKKGIKSLISLIMFALSLFFFSLKDDSLFFLILSSFFMLFSYGFLIISIVKNTPRVFYFVKGYLEGGLETAVVFLLLKKAESDNTLKEELIKCGVRRVKNDRNLISVLFRNFGKRLIVFLIEILLIIVSFYALKKVVLLNSGLTSSFQILFAPIVSIYALLK